MLQGQLRAAGGKVWEERDRETEKQRDRETVRQARCIAAVVAAWVGWRYVVDEGSWGGWVGG